MTDANEKSVDVTLAFTAMRRFLSEYWIRGGRESDDLADLLSSLDTGRRADSDPLDIALYRDWERICEELLNARNN